LNRGDLVRVFQRLKPSEVEQDLVVSFFGFEALNSVELPSNEPPLFEQRQTSPEPPSPREVDQAPSQGASFWMPSRCYRVDSEERDAEDPVWKAQNVFNAEDVAAQNVPDPKAPPLQPWSRLWPFLKSALGASVERGRLDERRWIHQVATVRPACSIPRRPILVWAQDATVIVDRRRALTPFWDDADELLRRVRQVRGGFGLRAWFLDDGDPEDEARQDRTRRQAKWTPPRETPVLALTDLGRLTETQQFSSAWTRVAARLRAQGNRVQALVPCPRSRWEPESARAWSAAVWDRGERLPRRTGANRSISLPRCEPDEVQATEHLLTLLSPLFRVEPGLLRLVRLALRREHGLGSVATEFEVWHHAETDRSSLAMVVLPGPAGERRQRLKSDPFYTQSLKQAVFDATMRYHGTASPFLYQTEAEKLGECGLTLSSEVRQQIDELFIRGAKTIVHQFHTHDREGQSHLGLLAWSQRHLQRLSRDETGHKHVAWLWGLVEKSSKTPLLEQPKDLDQTALAWIREQIDRGPTEETQWELRIIGETLHIHPWSPTPGGTPVPRLALGSHLGFIKSRKPVIDLTFFDAANRPTKTVTLRILPRTPTLFPVGSRAPFVLSTDCEELVFEPALRPKWAKRFGRDAFGLYAEFEVKKVIFTLRWIPPGTFMMGSPEDENGRDADEGPRHLVLISRGFWIQDTPATQEQWRSIRSKNPSHFKGSDRPAENIDWHTCQQFAGELSQALDPEVVFRLPTEAEWEYACRAGTLSAFNDGSPCTVPGGTDPALSRLGWHNEELGDGKTHPVGGLASNAWGLRDTHGNVWEWCADDRREYVDRFEIDPTGEVLGQARRVVRGGSCWNGARWCRSAYRSANGPEDRYWDFGFRLAAGQQASRPALGLEGGAEGRSPTGKPVRRARAYAVQKRPPWAVRWEEDAQGRIASFEVKGVQFPLRWIRPGNFMMGSPEAEAGRNNDERLHRVTLTRGFWLAETPCTQAQWRCITGKAPSFHKGDDLPVEQVSWDDCKAFCERVQKAVPGLSPRFPTEAEWEYACRAGTDSAFNDGSPCTQPRGKDPALDKLGWYDENSARKTHPVREKRPNAWGLYDMHGNVWEWCADSADLKEGVVTDTYDRDMIDPLCDTGTWRVVRGGSYRSSARRCRSACRGALGPENRAGLFGFRLAAGQPEEGEV